MPLRLRAERRAFSRVAARTYTQPNPSGGPNRAVRRKQRWRGDISTLVHGPHDRAWLYSGTENASGQARINHKRSQRAEYWRTVRIRVSAEMEPYFRATLHLLGSGTRISGRTKLLNWFALDVHIPGMPADAVTAVPIYRNEYLGHGRSEAHLHSVDWHRADGSRIPAESQTVTQ